MDQQNTTKVLMIVNSSKKIVVKMKRILFGISIFTVVIILNTFGDWLDINVRSQEKLENIKYILQWTSDITEPFQFMGVGSKIFIKRNCPIQKCYITHDRKYFGDIKMFDVILFHGPELSRQVWEIPSERSPKQKYVYTSMESSHYYPISSKYNNFFNWTWTYKLDSDLSYAYVTIRDKSRNVIGPKKVMHWMKVEEMKPIDDEIKSRLSNKSKAAAWFVSNCNSKSGREKVVADLIPKLNKFNLSVDIYGGCSNLSCARNSKDCFKMIEETYYFYLSFENSFSEDYVTEKLLNSLQNFAIPVVYGSANYTRFMPDGIYLDANMMSVAELAEQMHKIINDKELYYSYFKWHNHYSYHSPEEEADTDYYCNMCAKLHDLISMNQITEYQNFTQWWAS